MTIGAWLSDAKRANALVRAMPRVWLCQADLVSCAVNSLEKSAELGKDPSADLVQMNGLGFWFHSATQERMCFSSAWTER